MMHIEIKRARERYDFLNELFLACDCQQCNRALATGEWETNRCPRLRRVREAKRALNELLDARHDTNCECLACCPINHAAYEMDP